MTQLCQKGSVLRQLKIVIAYANEPEKSLNLKYCL